MKKRNKYPNKPSDSPKYDQLGDYEGIDSDGSDNSSILDKLNEESEDSSSEVEILPVHSESASSSEEEDDDDDDENDHLVSDSDIEGADDDGLPDPKAWGKHKRQYYNADHINDKNDFLNEEEEDAAKMEEEEARAIQKRLISELDNADLSIDLLSDIINEKKEEKEIQEKEKVELDLSQMSENEKMKLLKKECPELMVYIEDYKRLMTCLKDALLPIAKFLNTTVVDDEVSSFVKLYRQLIMNYCTNIVFFVLLKARKADTKLHPIAKWINRYQNMLSEMEVVFDSKIKPQIDVILSSDIKLDEVKAKKRKNNSKSKNSKLMRLESNVAAESRMNYMQNGIHAPNEDGDDEEGNEEEMDKRRPITYEMSKNKGLTPHRKKELRNPRVKHRMKYRKAKIRRKGQVREVRKEVQKYAGEISGINTNVVKSVKLKS